MAADPPLDAVVVVVRHRCARVVVEAPAPVVAALAADLAPRTAIERVGPGRARRAGASLRLHPGTGWNLTVDGATVHTAPPDALDRAQERLASEVHLALATHAPHQVFVHGGSVAWRGRAIVAPGPSRAGKSTLVRALVARGAALLSDEYAVFDRTGLVEPYARTVHVRRPEGAARIDPHRLGPVAGAPHPLGAVVDTAYVPGARWSPASGRSARSVVPLVANAVAAQVAPVRVLDHLTAAVARRPLLLTGPRGAADEAAESILALLDRECGGA